MAPQTKAAYAHSLQEAVEHLLSPHQHTAIRRRTGAAWEQICLAPGVSWIDEDPFNALTGAIREELGAAGSQEFFRLHGRRVVQSVLFQRLFEGAVRLIGLSPHSMLKMVPRGRNSVVRNGGEMTYKWVDPRTAHLILRNFPSSPYRSGTRVLLLSGSFLGMVDLAGHSASANVALQDVDIKAGHSTFVVSW